MTQTLLQFDHLQRVGGKLAPVILDFAAAHAGGVWHMADLAAYVTARVPNTAPASTDRILRMLRKAGELNYVVRHRASSLYEFTTPTNQ